MTLEDLIYKRISEEAGIRKRLAVFHQMPAVFYQAAPQDQASGWGGKRQYPRIDFIVDMQANPERQTSGALVLNIWSDGAGAQPEELEPIICECLCDVFLQPEAGPPFSLAWVRTEAFEQHNQASPNTYVVGVTMTFDIFGFPMQMTSDPDPILAMNEFIKNWAPQAVVIGKDNIPSFYRATGERPAFYFRLLNFQTFQETNAIVWLNATIAGHVFSSSEGRLQWLKALTEILALQGEVTMLDTSPMFLKNIAADSAADRLTMGQLRLSVRYGLLRRSGYAHPLLNPFFREDWRNQHGSEKYEW